MADDPNRPPLEGWHVPQRTGFIAALATPVLLGLAVVGAGYLYDRELRPLHRQPTTTFPAPGIETYIHDGQADPKRQPVRAKPDPSVEAAKQALVIRGVRGWTAPR